MRKITNLFLALGVIALMGVTTSCEDTATNPPTIAFLNGVNETTLDAGVTSYTIAGNISSDAGLSEVKFFQVTNAGETQKGNAISSFNDKNNYDFQFQVTNITEDVTIKVQATDKDNLTASKNFMIHFTAAGGEITTYSETVLGSYANTDNGSSFASVDGTVMKLSVAAANSQKVDFVYFNGSANAATIASPANSDAQSVFSGMSNWTTKNDTRFAKTDMTAADFDAITDDLDIVAAADGATDTKANQLLSDDVVAFVTASTSSNPGKKGLFKVVNIFGGADGTMSIIVKVQK